MFKAGKNNLSIKLAIAVCIATLFLFSIQVLVPIQNWLVAVVLGVLFIGVVVYAAAERLIAKRLKTVREALRAVAEHDFDYLGQIEADGSDELDELIRQIKEVGKGHERETADLERVEDYRRRFIGNVSHELKTPIFSILGYSDTLLDGALEDESVRRSFVEKIGRNAERLQNLARDLVEISRLESGESGMMMESFDLREVLLEVVESLDSVASQRRIAVGVGAASDLPPTFGDAKRIRQVLVNLIDNAVKYTDPGGRVSVTIRAGEPNHLRIAVQDNGIGIKEEHAVRITERFFRVDQSRSRALGGTGLGLAIVKHILAAHNQVISIDSEPGEGSTFSFQLRTDSSPEPV